MTLQDELRAGGSVPPPRPRRRWDLVAFWAVLAGPLAAVALWAGVRLRVGDLEERLVRDANAAFTASHPRKAHVAAPTLGSFGDAVLAHLPAVQARANELKDDGAARVARAVVAGDRPLSALPEAWARALSDLEPDLDALLHGTRAERADLPMAREPFLPCDGGDWTGYQLAALLAGVRVRRALAAGDEAAAARDCLDGLALGRDAAVAAGVIGRMVARAVGTRLAPACASALASLRPAERAEALGSVRAIRDAHPSVEEMFRVEFLSEELLTFGPAMSSRARARLAPAALPHLRAGERHVGWLARLLLLHAWRPTRATWDRFVRVARKGPGEGRDAEMAAIHDGTLGETSPLLAMLPTKAWARYARRADAATATLDALVLAAAAAEHRDRTGAWPPSVEALAAAGLLMPAEAGRTAAAALSPRDGGRSLELRLPLPAADEKDPREVALRISRRAPSGAR